VEYATRAGARPGWLFVTGPRDAVAALLRDGFHVAFADDGPRPAPITHSDRFVLVDGELRIRGYYHGSDEADVARLVRDTTALRDGERRDPARRPATVNAYHTGYAVVRRASATVPASMTSAKSAEDCERHRPSPGSPTAGTVSPR